MSKSYEMRRATDYDESRYGQVTTAERGMRIDAMDAEDRAVDWKTRDRGGWSFASLWAEGWNGPFSA